LVLCVVCYDPSIMWPVCQICRNRTCSVSAIGLYLFPIAYRICGQCKRFNKTHQDKVFSRRHYPLTPNDDYSGRSAPLTSKCCILYIYSTNTGTEYFKHGIYSPSFPLQNAVYFISITYLVPVLFTFYIQDVLKLKKIIPAPKG